VEARRFAQRDPGEGDDRWGGGGGSSRRGGGAGVDLCSLDLGVAWQ